MIKAVIFDVGGVLYDEVLDYAHELQKRGLKLGALSNTASPYYGIVRGSRMLAGFDDVVLSFEVGLSKPDPAIYRLALERLGVEADEAVYVDDTVMNVEAAEGVGMHGIEFEDAAKLRKDLEALLSNMPE